MRPGARGLPITLDLEGARVLVVGSSDEAARRLELLREAGAEVVERSAFDERDLDGTRLLLVMSADGATADRARAAARARGVLSWVADDPARSDFAMPAVARLGAARLAASTSGASPGLSARLRAAFERDLGDRFARFVDALAARRAEARRDEPDPARRRTRLLALLDGFSLTLEVRYPDWFA